MAAGLLVAAFAGVRLPGEGASGSVTLSSTQQLQATLEQASILGSEGKVSEAVQLYQQVLASDPNQPVALAYGGWLIRLAGLSEHKAAVVVEGDARIRKAVEVAPTYADGHALLAIVELSDLRDPRAAVGQFRLALAAHPSAALVASVAAEARQAFAATHQDLPQAYRAGATNKG